MDVKARFKLDVPFGERGLRWGHLEVIGGRTVAPSATSVVCPSPSARMHAIHVGGMGTQQGQPALEVGHRP
jgi:hypothetical protein